MTAKEAAALIGRSGTVRTGPFTVRVMVLDVKSAYGETRYQVRPHEGSGVAWVTGATFNLEESREKWAQRIGAKMDAAAREDN